MKKSTKRLMKSFKKPYSLGRTARNFRRDAMQFSKGPYAGYLRDKSKSLAKMAAH